MAKVGAQRAAELTGKSKSTVQRAMNSGKVSYELDTNGRRIIDVSELERVFGLTKSDTSGGTVVAGASVEQELEKASSMLDTERMKMRVQMLEQQLETAETQVEDLKNQRDQWQKQASQVLITSEFSQKQAEELREEIKDRDRRVKERRQQKLDQQMQKLKAQNENSQGKSSRNENVNKGEDESFNFKGLWKRVKKRA